MRQKIIFIINPHSGVDRVKALESIIEKHLDQDQFNPEIVRTEYAGHGTILAQEAYTAGHRYIVAVGGDGSVNDVGKALVGTDAIMGIIPLGSGNGLARTLNIPLNPVQAIALLNRRKAARIDVGYANDILFLSNAGVGFDSVVVYEFRNSKRRGFSTYIGIILKHILTYKSLEWYIEIDGKSMRKKAFMITAANASQLGYNFKIAPLAELQDGLLDVVIIRKFPKIMGGFLGLKAFKGTLHHSSYVDYFKAQQIRVRHPDLQYFQVDGDVHACTDGVLDIKILRKQLSIIF